MKRVYFVRHGESETNVGDRHIGPTAALTEKGRKQASFMARRAHSLPIDIIIASTMTRAQETAGIIAAEIGIPIESSDLFVERIHPSAQRGRLKEDPDSKLYEKEFIERFADPAWRFDDAENFDDLHARAAQALQFLESRPEDHILVVSHGIFMSILVAEIIMGEKLTGSECIRIIRGFYMDNTGLTELEYDASPASRWPLPWRLRIWNDHSHLADS